MPVLIFRCGVGTRWCLAMGQDRFCAVWVMYSHSHPDNEKLCCKQRPSTACHGNGVIQAVGALGRYFQKPKRL